MDINFLKTATQKMENSLKFTEEFQDSLKQLETQRNLAVSTGDFTTFENKIKEIETLRTENNFHKNYIKELEKTIDTVTYGNFLKGYYKTAGDTRKALIKAHEENVEQLLNEFIETLAQAEKNIKVAVEQVPVYQTAEDEQLFWKVQKLFKINHNELPFNMLPTPNHLQHLINGIRGIRY